MKSQLSWQQFDDIDAKRAQSATGSERVRDNTKHRERTSTRKKDERRGGMGERRERETGERDIKNK